MIANRNEPFDILSNIKSGKSTDKSTELFERIKKLNNIPPAVFKMQTIDEFMGILATINGIIYIIKEEKYSMSMSDSKNIKILLANLNLAKSYYIKNNSIDYSRAVELKKLGEKQYYEYEKPSRFIAIDWITTRIEDNLKEVRYY